MITAHLAHAMNSEVHQAKLACTMCSNLQSTNLRCRPCWLLLINQGMINRVGARCDKGNGHVMRHKLDSRQGKEMRLIFDCSRAAQALLVAHHRIPNLLPPLLLAARLAM